MGLLFSHSSPATFATPLLLILKTIEIITHIYLLNSLGSLTNRIIRDITATVKPVTKSSKTGVELSFTITTRQTCKICSDALRDNGIADKVI
ncbi:hypothetical protein ACFLTK_05950 [Chloroflexota bacterium]